jgi:fatty-acyl-CoA synthase
MNEPGEAIGRIFEDASNLGNRFEGYSGPDATGKKILRNVFERGDAWFRTGDLLRKDKEGYFYFVDRIGDTFRWKGENVSTTEVAEALSAFPGILQANVYGVESPGADGRAGMAALAVADDLDLAALQSHLAACLPGYAHPLFLRIRRALEVTGTFKYTKAGFVRDGYTPAATDDTMYFNDRERGEFVRLDEALYARIQSGEVRL